MGSRCFAFFLSFSFFFFLLFTLFVKKFHFLELEWRHGPSDEGQVFSSFKMFHLIILKKSETTMSFCRSKMKHVVPGVGRNFCIKKETEKEFQEKKTETRLTRRGGEENPIFQTGTATEKEMQFSKTNYDFSLQAIINNAQKSIPWTRYRYLRVLHKALFFFTFFHTIFLSLFSQSID